MVAVGNIERSLVSIRLFRPFPLNSYQDSEAGRSDCQGRGAGHARRVALTIDSACFIGKVEFKGKGLVSIDQRKRSGYATAIQLIGAGARYPSALCGRTVL